MKQNSVEETIKNVSSEPLHGSEFYTPEMESVLAEAIKKITDVIKSKPELTDYEKIIIINNYIKDNVSLHGEYFDAMKLDTEIPEHQLKYRTAYAALVERKAICIGFAEATRMLLDSVGVKSKTHLAMLPDPVAEKQTGKKTYKKFFHYLVVADCKTKNGQTLKIVLDPERQASREKAGKSYPEYMETIQVVTNPPPEFVQNKLGKNGLGEATINIPYISSKGVNEIGCVLTDQHIDEYINGSKNLPEQGEI